MNVLFGRLSPCQCNEGKQDGDDGFLVHFISFFSCKSTRRISATHAESFWKM